MPRVRYFAQAREAAGTGAEVVPGGTVAEVLAAVVARHGERLAAVLPSAAVWLDGEPAEPCDLVAEDAEVAVLPPVSGGCCPICPALTAAEAPLLPCAHGRA